MTKDFTETLSDAIVNDDAQEIHRSLSQFMNNYFELKLDELDDINDLNEDVTHTVTDNEGTDLETQFVSNLISTAKSMGADPDIEYQEGTMLMTFQKKEPLRNFINWTYKNCDYIDDYEVEAFRTDAFDQVEELDFDAISDDAPWSYVLTIHIDPDIVQFHEDDEEDDTMEEALKRIAKVDATGKKSIKMKCGKGFKWSPARHACEKITGAELISKRKSIKKALRTKKSMGAMFKVRMVKKMKKAKKFRKGYGLK